MPTQRAAHRVAVGSLAQGKGGVGQLAQQLVAAENPEIQRRRFLPGHLLGHQSESGSFVEHPLGAFGVVFRDDHHLLQPTALRLVELVLPLLEGLTHLFLGHRDLLGQFRHLEQNGGERPVFRRREKPGAFLVELGKGGLVGFRGLRHLLVGDDHHLGYPLLLAVAVERLDQGLGRRGAGGDALRKLPTHQVAADEFRELVLAIAVVLDDLLEKGPVERLGNALERGIALDFLPYQLVADDDSHFRGTDVEQGLLDETPQDHVDNAQGTRLFGGQSRAQPDAQVSEFPLVFVVESLGRDVDVADGGHVRGSGAAAENVADAPGGETEDQEPEQDLDHK